MSHSIHRKKGLFFYLGFICAIFWGAGTNIFSETLSPWWYVFQGISVGEVIFLALLLMVVFDKFWRRQFELSFSQLRNFSLMLFSLALILSISVVVNIPIYGGDFQDLAACLRLIYFLLITIFVNAYTRQYGTLSMLLPFIIGLAIVGVEQCVYAFFSPEAVVLRGAIPMVRDPNVAGALFGYGIIFCAIALFHNGRLVYWFFAIAFSLASILSFSKASWIMVFFGLIACICARKITKTKLKFKAYGIKRALLIFLLIFVFSINFQDYYDKVEGLISQKIETTQDNASVQDRFNLALVGVYAMLQNPLLGVGYRNYDAVGNKYPELIIPNSGNANNVFIQIGAIGGIIPLMIILYLFFFPFKILYGIVKYDGIYGKIYYYSIFVVMFIFSSVQLQLVAQPVFWVFIGVISGWKTCLTFKN